MALPKFKTTDMIDGTLRGGPRMTHDGDGPVASPVHALQQLVHERAATIAAPTSAVPPAAMRIFLFAVVPFMLWAGVIKAATSLI